MLDALLDVDARDVRMSMAGKKVKIYIAVICCLILCARILFNFCLINNVSKTTFFFYFFFINLRLRFHGACIE